jgi:hypothetical protein
LGDESTLSKMQTAHALQPDNRARRGGVRSVWDTIHDAQADNHGGTEGTEMNQKKITFKMKLRDLNSTEIEVSIDCERIGHEIGRRVIHHNKSGKATACYGAIVVRRVHKYQS